jgi:hypothetical protein
LALWQEFCDDFGRNEFELERYLDHFEAMLTIQTRITAD